MSQMSARSQAPVGASQLRYTAAWVARRIRPARYDFQEVPASTADVAAMAAVGGSRSGRSMTATTSSSRASASFGSRAAKLVPTGAGPEVTAIRALIGRGRPRPRSGRIDRPTSCVAPARLAIGPDPSGGH
jgi:hypothetical protein